MAEQALTLDRAQIEHKMAMDAVQLATFCLDSQTQETLQRLVDAEQRSHGIMHITDPTAYQRTLHSKNFQAQVAMAHAALRFVKEMKRIIAELETATNG
jgi:hypothetical protein